MAYDIEVTDEFKAWFEALPEDIQDAVDRAVNKLIDYGPQLGRPHADVVGYVSQLPNLKELRITYRGDQYRVLFVFDPRRVAILLLGDRKPDEKWYKKAVPVADKLYAEYLDELRREGLLPKERKQ